MKKVLSIVLAIVMMLSLVSVMTACNNTTDDDAPVAALICLHGDSSTYDKNFIDAFKAACKAKGLNENQYTIVTNIPEGPECREQALNFADLGYKVVFADSFGHESFIIEAAKEATDVQFCHATGVMAHTLNLSNYHNSFASIYQGRYLAGVAAGLKLQEMIDNNQLKAENYDENGNIKLGYVGAYTYAEVVSGYTSWYLGVKSVVSNVVMDVTFTGSWYDEQAEKDAAKLLISRGVALVSQHADSMGAPTACEEAGVPNVSYNGSTESACPNTFIVSSRINWQPYFEYMIDCALNNKTIDVDKLGTLSDNSVVLTTVGGAAAAGTQAKLDEVKAKLISGEVKVFDCANFTVTVTDSLNTNATVDANGHLVSYMADTDGDYVGDANVIKTENGITFFDESSVRSAPYFDVNIDGINLLNTAF